jgi:hypothetical protein
LGDQAPTAKAIKRNLTNVLRVYREILKYYEGIRRRRLQRIMSYIRGRF